MKKFLIPILVLAGVLAGGWYYVSQTGRAEFAGISSTAFQRIQPSRYPDGASYSPADLEEVPPVMRAYLQKAMPPGGSRTRRVRLALSGETKVTEESSWDRFTARQEITANPPQTVWAGEIDYAPLIPLMTLNTFYDGTSMVRSYLWGLSNTFTNQGEVIQAYLMQRWLGEAVWYPDALLPDENLRWKEEETATKAVKTARVEFTLAGLTVSGRFIFPAGGGAPMLFLGDSLPFDRFADQRWYCSYSDWRRQDGRQVPFSLTQGVRRGAGDDQRHRIKVESITYE